VGEMAIEAIRVPVPVVVPDGDDGESPHARILIVEPSIVARKIVERMSGKRIDDGSLRAGFSKRINRPRIRQIPITQRSEEPPLAKLVVPKL
jgi:hypothetical protein